MGKQFFIIFISLLLPYCVIAQDSDCGRTVEINGENVAIDSSSTQKGEGLRYYLTKDPESKKYFDQYTESNKPNWKRIGVSTFGMGLIIAGALSSNETNNDLLKRDTLLGAGVAIFAISFVYAKTKQSEREIYLQQSIKEYNKRNEPKIIVSPQYRSDDSSWGILFSREY